MRSISRSTCVVAGLLLAACSSSPDFPEDRYSGVNNPALYDDAAASNSPIPPTARARRAANPYPNSQGVSPAVRAQVIDQRSDYAAPPPGGYYASPRARAQVESEINAEYESRDQAFGGASRGEPRPIDLGPGPGLSRIAPGTRYGEEADFYRRPPDLGYTPRDEYRESRGQDRYGYDDPANASYDRYRSGGYGQSNIPDDAPPLPRSARPGDCYILIANRPGYRDIYERQQVSSDNYQWREVVCESDVSSALVRDLQRALRGAGFSPGAIDGVFGPRTQRALNAYQEHHNLPVDNRINVITLSDLGLVRR